MGVILDAVARASADACAYCSGEDRPIKRVGSLGRCCDRCYPNAFPTQRCVQCERPARIEAGVGEQVCAACTRARQICVRCERPMERAGLRVGRHLACSACARYFKDPRECSVCGRESRRWQYQDGKPTCLSCCSKESSATCSRCRRFRPVGEIGADGEVRCSACLADTSHRCPDCLVIVPGAGAGRCQVCLNRRAVRREAALAQAGLQSAWASTWVGEYAEWLLAHDPERPALHRVFVKHAQLFVLLETHFGRVAPTAQEQLVEQLGRARLRAYLLASRFVAQKLTRNSEIVDDPHVTQRALTRSVQVPSAGLLQAFGQELSHSSIRPITQRQYISTATKFMESLAYTGRDVPNAADLTAFLRTRPGQHANLQRFVSFGVKTCGWSCSMPAKPSLSKAPSTVGRVRKLLSKLLQKPIQDASNADLIAIIALLHGFPKQCLAAAALKLEEAPLTLRVDEEAVVLDSRLKGIAEELVRRRNAAPQRD